MVVNIFFLSVDKRNSLKFEGGKLAVKAPKGADKGQAFLRGWILQQIREAT
jgi:hypothetical protein